MVKSLEDEIRAAIHSLIETRDRICKGELKDWSALEAFYTEDAVFIDPAWGRVEGLDNMRRFWIDSMAGLESWDYPTIWTMVDGHRVVVMADQIQGREGDGTVYAVPLVSILYYAGDGKFCYELDMMNMQHVMEVMKKQAWRMPADYRLPKKIDRDWSLPEAWRHLAKDGLFQYDER